MQVKDYLSRYHKPKEKIKLLEKEIEELIR